MKLCDRHFAKGENVKAVDIIKVGTESIYDVCESCKAELLKFLEEPEAFRIKPGPKK